MADTSASEDTARSPGGGGSKPRSTFAIIAGLVLLVVVLLVIVVSQVTGDDNDNDDAGDDTSRSFTVTDPPAVPTAPSTAATPVKPLAKDEVTVDCRLQPARPRPGQVAILTYAIEAVRDGTVALGAGVYDEAGEDQSEGTGDQDRYVARHGRHLVSRPMVVPAGLRAGRFEIVAELWPPDDIGQGDSIAEANCAVITVTSPS